LGPFSHFGPKKRCPKPPLQGTCQDQHQLGGSVAGRQGRQHVAASRQQETNDQAPGGREVGCQHAGEDLGRWDMLGPWIQGIPCHVTGSAMFWGADVRMHIVFQAVKEISNILATNMGMYWKRMMINH